MKYSLHYERVSRITYELTETEIRDAILAWLQDKAKTAYWRTCPDTSASTVDVEFAYDEDKGTYSALVTRTFTKVESPTETLDV